MKRLAVVVTGMAVLAVLSGCGSPKAKRDKTIFGMMQEKATIS